jgi:cytochrome c-type biogenesis protein CcmE
MTHSKRFLIGALLLVGAVGYLMYTGVQQTAVYYLTMDEFFEREDSLVNEGVRIAGRVQSGSVSRRMTPRGEELQFRLGDFDADAGDGLPVYFVGVTPDMFKDGGGTDVIVEGVYRDGVLQAQSVLTSCPSKYEAEAQPQ